MHCRESDVVHTQGFVFVVPEPISGNYSGQVQTSIPYSPTSIMSNFIIAMGEYPSPITAALNRSFIEEHLSTSEPIRLMVAAIARAQQNVTNVEQVEPLNVTDAKTIDQSILRSHLMSLSLEPDEGVSETTLLYFVLLCIYEVRLLLRYLSCFIFPCKQLLLLTSARLWSMPPD